MTSFAVVTNGQVWNVERICDVAAKDVRADQPAHVEVAVFANDDRVMRHVMRLV